MKTTSYKHIFSAALLAMAGTLMTGCVEETFPTGSFHRGPARRQCLRCGIQGHGPGYPGYHERTIFL